MGAPERRPVKMILLGLLDQCYRISIYTPSSSHPPAQDVKNSASSILIVEKPEIHETNGKINRVPTSQVFQHRTKLKTLAETASPEQEVQSQHYQRATHKN